MIKNNLKKNKKDFVKKISKNDKYFIRKNIS